MQVLGLDHVGIAADDADAAGRLFSALLDLPVVHREVNPDQGVAEVMIGTPQDRPAVQIVAPAGPGSSVAGFLGRRGPGLHHIAFRVADIDAAVAELLERGIRLVDDRPGPGTGGSRIVFVHPRDAGGVLVELVEAPRPGRAPARPERG